MNQEVMLHWTREVLLPALAAKGDGPHNKAVIVLDRAKYHTTLAPGSTPATPSMSKAALVDWLISKKLKIGGMLATKHILLDKARVATTKTNKARHVKGYTQEELFSFCGPLQPTAVFAVQACINAFNTAQGTDMKLLFLPVAHPQLNPIELAVEPRQKPCCQEQLDLANERRQGGG